ncbi:DUF4126 domain-containing protein [Virgisporangium ochraceum]|uniref:DUF4126 domain-containing protein n=1 Tax=Virgisporangium ochraceum TaxID=65505 RepID=UPI001943CB46|nr:DUF4126 domain-containing protein [Virgisporangium ochraceum]
MLEALMGTGLAASAGLNAYIPLLLVGVLARFTDVITLPESWQWIENPWMLGIFGVLLTIEFFADKIPVVDHVNDFVQTVVRPTSGGIMFGASSGSQTAVITDPANYFESKQWVPVVVGIAISLCVHLMKAGFRAAVNSLTLGFGAPVVSVAEDTVSIGMALSAILAPLLVILFLIVLILVFWWAMRRRKRRKAAKLAAARGY